MSSKNKNSYIPGVSDKEVIAVLRVPFSGVDGSIVSKIKKPEKYGVDFIPAAKEIIEMAFGQRPVELPEKRRKDGHRYTRRVECRLSDDDAERLQKDIADDCRFQNASQLVYWLVHGYMQGRDRARKRKTAVPVMTETAARK